MMGEGLYLDLVLYAMVAGLLVYRLRSVLGRRTGEERQRPNPFGNRPANQDAADNVINLPDRMRAGTAPAATPVVDAGPASLAAGLAQIKAADPTFDEKQFLQGARAAFLMIVEAFARGDTATLRPLLSDDVYENFASAIRDRAAAGETLETKVLEIKDVDILEAGVDKRVATVLIKFVTEQTNLVSNAAGTVIDGDPNRSLEVVDLWTFSRNTRSRDPNWFLVETNTPN